MKDVILNKIRSRTVKVVVFGLGHIGLPKAAAIAKAGFQVVGVDLNSKIVEAISEGGIGINEPRLSDVIKQVAKKGFLKATLNGSEAAKEAAK